MAKHRKFSADRFLDKFQGHEALIRAFARTFEPGLNGLDLETLDVPAFKGYLINGEGDRKDDLVEGLYQAYDLCTTDGHEALVAACAGLAGYDPDIDGALHVECLSLKVLTERPEAFELAYAHNSLTQAQRFTIVRGKVARAITDPSAAAARFEAKMREVFKGDKKSDRVLVRQYQEGNRTNFVVYHERRTKAELTFGGTKSRPRIAPKVFRPAQQDFVSYDHTAGQVEIETRFEKEETSIRQGFAECCLGDAEFFEDEGAASRLVLDKIAEPGFELRVKGRDLASLVDLRFTLPQTHGPSFAVRSKNVLSTLEKNGLRSQLGPSMIQRATFKIVFPDDARGKRVELSGVNSVKFNRATHADDVFAYLDLWKVLR